MSEEPASAVYLRPTRSKRKTEGWPADAAENRARSDERARYADARGRQVVRHASDAECEETRPDEVNADETLAPDPRNTAISAERMRAYSQLDTQSWDESAVRAARA